MPQEILSIIIPQEIELDKSIVHFYENGLTFIPIDFCYLNPFVKGAQNFDLLSAYFEHIKSQKDFVEAKGFDENDELDAVLIKFIENHQINTFIIEEYFEHEYTPFESIREKGYLRTFDFNFFYVENGKIISSYSSIEDPVDENPSIKYRYLQKYRDKMSIEINWTEQKRFYSYEDSKKEYLK